MSLNATLFAQLIAFICFVAFCMKYVWPPIVKAIEERQNNITDALNKAEQAKLEMADLQNLANEELVKARKKASEIVELAEQQQDEIIRRAIIKAEQQKKRVLQEGLVELEQAKKQAQKELQEQLADLVTLGIKQILEKNIDPKEKAEIINKIAQKL